MRSLPEDEEAVILRQVLGGDSYRKTADDNMVSISTVSRVVADARKKRPNIDTLTALNTALRKNGQSLFDALRGSRLLERLNEYGISLQEIEYCVKVVERLVSEKDLGDHFLTYAIKLMQLEETCGRPYQTIVEEYEQKLQETARLEDKTTNLEKTILELEADVKKTQEDLDREKSETEEMVTAQKGLREIGVKRLARFVKFIQEFESLGLDANKVKKLADWQQKLKSTGIDPDNLKESIAEREPLFAQNTALRYANDRLTDKNAILANSNKKLLEENSALRTVDQILTTKTTLVACKSCRMQISILLPTRENYAELIANGRTLNLWCPNCGISQLYDPREILNQIGWILLPSETSTA